MTRKEEQEAAQKPAFTLHAHQVPDLPAKATWKDALRWMICVMDSDDKAFPFIAGVFAYCLDNEGTITERQAKASNQVFNRVIGEWRAGVLDCQNSSLPVPREQSVEHMETQGEA